MKKFTTIVFAAILFFNIQLFSQTGLLVTDKDYTNYPEVTFEYFLFKNSINQNSILTKNDIIILSNDINITEKAIVCPNETQNDDNKVIISIDLSIDNSSFLFDSVKSAVKLIYNNDINADFALTSYSTVNHLNYDFNQSHSTLDIELDRIKNSIRSNIDSVFYSLPIGSNEIFKNVSQESKKSIVLFTDQNRPINTEILDKLKNDNINLFLVLIGKEAQLETQQYFGSNDSYFLFENIDNSNLKLVSLAVNEIVNGNYPCSISFNSIQDCDTNVRIDFSVPSISSNNKYFFNINSDILPRLELTPNFYGFSSVLPGNSKIADVVISPVNKDITIDSIYFEEDKNGIFKILSGQITSSQTLTIGSNWPIKIEYEPLDSNIVFTKLIIRSDACLNEEVLITGGFPNTPPIVKNIEIVSPNECDEKLIVGDNYKVSWTGLLPSDVIQLEFSTDNGINWDTLATNVTDLNHSWMIPDLESEECLVRGIQLWPNNIGRTLDLLHPKAVNSAFFDHVDGSKAVTSCEDGIVRLWNTNTGRIIRTYNAHNNAVNYAIFSPNDDKIVSSSNDTNIILWDVNDGSTPLHIINDHTDVVRTVNFSPNGEKILSVDKSGVCKIFDVNSGDEEHSFSPDGTKPLWYGGFHPSGNYYLTGGNGGSVKVWNVSDNSFEKEFDIVGWVNQFAINKDGSRILIVDILNKEATVWDFESGTELFKLKHQFQTNLPLNSGSFNEIGNEEFMLTSGDDNTAIMWDSEGDSVNVFREHTNSVRTAMFNFDGQRVLTSSWDNTAKVWNLNERDLQMDTSDCVFTITKLNFEKNDLLFENTFIGDYRDSTLENALVNLNNFQFPIRNAFLRGVDKDDFKIFSELKNQVIDTLNSNNSISLNARFSPKTIGLKKAELVLDIPGSEVIIQLSGLATKKDLEVVTNYILFDKVDIGDFRDKVVDVAVRNNSDKSLTIDSIYIDIPRNNDYSLILENEIKSLENGADLNLIARFAPQFIDLSNADIVFIHDGNNSPTRISLLGSGSVPVFDTTTVKINDFGANSGEIVNAIISINTLKNELKNDEFEGISFDLSFNSTLLVPNFQFENDRIENGIRTINIKLESDDSWFELNGKEDKLQSTEIEIANLEFNTALGNDSISSLNINSPNVIGKAKLKLYEEDGSFRLLDLCYEGGTRFFDATNQFTLESPSPNPLINSTYLNYELLEDGFVSLDIIDYNGNIVTSLVQEYKEIGRYSIPLTIEALSSGVYFIRLQTQTQNIVRKIQIEK